MSRSCRKVLSTGSAGAAFALAEAVGVAGEEDDVDSSAVDSAPVA